MYVCILSYSSNFRLQAVEISRVWKRRPVLPQPRVPSSSGGRLDTIEKTLFLEDRDHQAMMTTRELFRYLRAEPFRPFRIHMASGRTFDIRHPEMVRVGRSDLVIFSLVTDEPDVHDDWDTVSLLLVESISHFDTTVSQQ